MVLDLSPKQVTKFHTFLLLYTYINFLATNQISLTKNQLSNVIFEQNYKKDCYLRQNFFNDYKKPS